MSDYRRLLEELRSKISNFNDLFNQQIRTTESVLRASDAVEDAAKTFTRTVRSHHSSLYLKEQRKINSSR